MPLDKKIIAVITSSPALGSIITMMLEGQDSLHVQQFGSFESVVTHMRIAPIDLVVCDYQLDSGSALDLVAMLRKSKSNRRYKLIVLVDHITREIKLGCKFANVDEVIVKPMSPLFLNERILFRLGCENTSNANTDITQPFRHQSLAKRRAESGASKSSWGDNVVPLFAARELQNSKLGDPQQPN